MPWQLDHPLMNGELMMQDDAGSAPWVGTQQSAGVSKFDQSATSPSGRSGLVHSDFCSDSGFIFVSVVLERTKIRSRVSTLETRDFVANANDITNLSNQTISRIIATAQPATEPEMNDGIDH